jgi:hypothetical protein
VCRVVVGQCAPPVKGADKYNDLVCKAFASSQNGDDKKALEFYLGCNSLSSGPRHGSVYKRATCCAACRASITQNK